MCDIICSDISMKENIQHKPKRFQVKPDGLLLQHQFVAYCLFASAWRCPANEVMHHAGDSAPEHLASAPADTGAILSTIDAVGETGLSVFRLQWDQSAQIKFSAQATHNSDTTTQPLNTSSGQLWSLRTHSPAGFRCLPAVNVSDERRATH